ncbi:MAG TPA: cytochrome c peroxidase [Archangium sp.]|uniref:cytochrome-c peroxidase n=1 Tax=Archangium sp. TaxID=1872627 RepID=UPI002E33A8F6|nr:cytochrome c peroxidase [Archangium sp.]HEX5754450.1 cytochrome c peroxidase [Archangium sp.]
MRLLSIMLLGSVLTACGTGELVTVPSGFPAMRVPEDNALSRERVELGKRLFFDTRLSRTGEVACASCHQQENAFADPRRVSEGVEGRLGTRNAPPLFNLAWNTSFFWDGGAPTLEHQVIGPIVNPLEMDMRMEDVVSRVAADASYVRQFQAAYGQKPGPEGVTKALASFMRTLVSGDSRYDRFQKGEDTALSDTEKRGMNLFFSERAECFHCHVGFNLTNNGFHNNGTRPDDPDLGREAITERPSDRGKFKVPSLRNVAVTAPYMHDGSLATLEDVVEHYSQGGQGHPNTDPTLHPLELTAQEKADLAAFLRALTDEAFLADPRFQPDP